jgi:FkbM family methyltransferase
MLRKIGPWFFPASDTQCADAVIQQVLLIEAQWLSHVKGRRVCVQAGGNCGLFPSKLAVYFDAVYTAEPDVENFLCLAMNCPSPNVYPFRAAFGAKPGTIGLHRTEGNAGGHYVEGEGTIPVITIDSLNLPACDLIALDIEGAEFVALQGAVETIGKYHPTLILEDKGHVRRFNQTSQEMHTWLRHLGYDEAGWAWRDRIWIHR